MHSHSARTSAGSVSVNASGIIDVSVQGALLPAAIIAQSLAGVGLNHAAFFRPANWRKT